MAYEKGVDWIAANVAPCSREKRGNLFACKLSGNFNSARVGKCNTKIERSLQKRMDCLGLIRHVPRMPYYPLVWTKYS